MSNFWDCAVLAVFLTAPFVQALVPSCFYPDGSLSTTDLACNLTAEFSFCCSPGFACLGNKICDGPGYINNTAVPYNRGSCSDPTWRSPDCPNFCTGVNNNDFTGDVLVQCDPQDNPNEVCCYDTTASDPLGCCTNSTATIFTLSGEATAFNQIVSADSTATRSLPATTSSNISTTSTGTGAAASITSATSSSPTASSSTAPTSTHSAAHGLSGGAIAGIAIGAVVGVGLITAGIWIFYKRSGRRQRKQEPNLSQEGYRSESSPTAPKQQAAAAAYASGIEKTDHTIPAELHSENHVAELEPSMRHDAELEG